MPLEDREAAAGMRIPEPDRAILTTAHREVPVRGKRHTVDPCRITLEYRQTHAPGHVPQPHRAIMAGTGRQLPVCAECNPPHRAVMALQLSQRAAAGHMPKPHRAIASTAGDELSVRAERHTPHRPGMPNRGKHQRSVRHSPHPHLARDRTRCHIATVGAERSTNNGFERFSQNGLGQLGSGQIYRSDERLTVAALMPGVLAADVRGEVTPDRRLILSGKSRRVLKEDRDFLVDEWAGVSYRREILLPNHVAGGLATVTLGNGVVVVALPLAERTQEALLSLEPMVPGHGLCVGSSGRPVEARSTAEFLDAQQRLAAEHSFTTR